MIIVPATSQLVTTAGKGNLKKCSWMSQLFEYNCVTIRAKLAVAKEILRKGETDSMRTSTCSFALYAHIVRLTSRINTIQLY